MVYWFSEKCVKRCSIVGAHLITAPYTFIWTFGNLSAYMDSYFRFSCSPGCTYGDSQWILSVATALMCPGIIISKFLANRMGLQWAGIVSAVILNGSLFGSAWTVQHSVVWTTVLFGAVVGLVQGVTTVVAFQNVTGWAPDKAPLFIATTTVVPTLLSMLMNQVITAVVNSENLKPDAMLGSRTYFSQPEILDRVPTAFIVYAAINSGLQFVGYLLLSSPPIPNEKLTAVTAKDERGNWRGQAKSRETAIHKQGKNFQNKSAAGTIDDYGSHDIIISPISHQNGSETAIDENSASISEIEDNQVSLKPSEVLKTPTFYAIFMFVIATSYALMLKADYYKQFALLYIHNDRYLTLIGTLIPVIAAVSRFCTGAVLNRRILTTKETMIMSASINCVLCSLWFFVPQVSAVLYLFFMLCLALVQSQYFVVVPVACLEIFGPAHFSTNYGLTLASLAIVGIVSPLVISPLMHELGWFWLFGSASLLCFVTLVLVLCADFNPPKASR